MNSDPLRVIQSPEELKTDEHPGVDETNTREDWHLVVNWGLKIKVLTIPSSGRGKYEYCFNVIHALLPDVVIRRPIIWYYIGHGLDKEKASKLHYSASPCVSHDREDMFSERNVRFLEKCKQRKVRGGELFLHGYGFCDLYGLLRYWFLLHGLGLDVFKDVESFREHSSRHLVVILDSCYAGELAQQLPKFLEDIKHEYSSTFDETNITIQAACGTDERTFGGYFTPVFTYLNDPDNMQLLENLKTEWAVMTEEDKRIYRLLDLPSPMVVTAGPPPEGITMEISLEERPLNGLPRINDYAGSKVTLFPVAEFFKFCFVMVHRYLDKTSFKGQDRVLNFDLANQFMSSGRFEVLDYKLKTFKGSSGPYAGSPLGLFLLEDPNDKDKVICAHIHFARDDTSCHTRINLIHHKKPPFGNTSLINDEDHDGLSKTAVKKDKHKIQVSLDKNARQLVEACHQFVDANEKGRWKDVSKWNMEGGHISFKGRFRLTRERSAWEDKYLEYIKKFDLPKVSSNRSSSNAFKFKDCICCTIV